MGENVVIIKELIQEFHRTEGNEADKDSLPNAQSLLKHICPYQGTS